jgi:hypothetical protein
MPVDEPALMHLLERALASHDDAVARGDLPPAGPSKVLDHRS